MKMKNEEEENEEFFPLFKRFHFMHMRSLERADFKSVFGFLRFFLDQKLWLVKVGKKDIKNPNTDLKSALSKVFICQK